MPFKRRLAASCRERGGLARIGGTNSSDINSNDILTEVKHPDPSTGASSGSYNEIFTVNAAGQNTTYTDQNDTKHEYSYDVLGRMTIDKAATLGSGVDGGVRRLEFSFDTGGRGFQFTSYDASSGGNVVNQVQRDYNGLGQLTKEYQEHAGAVNTGTSLKVQYAYSEMASGANHSRITSMTYPNGTALTYGYGSGLDDSISRLTTLAYSTLNTETLSYLGLGTVVKRVESEPGIELTYVKLSGESNGDAGDQYIGLDRFGRIEKQRWIVTSSGTARDYFVYGYDRNSNRLYRDNQLDNNFDELYHADGASNGYDSLNQLLEFQRGPLSDTNSDNIPDTVSSQTRRQVWTMDGQGNFSDVTTDGTAQSRTHDKQNRLTVVASNNLAYDSNGNMTTDETGKTLVYDAWDRFVQFKNGETVVDTFKYDAVGRRVSENPGTTRDLYYAAGWQVIEERTSGAARAHNVWSPVYVDAMVFRYRDSDSNGTLDERLYVMQDANFNVTGLLDTSGAAQERTVYDPYGAITYLTGSFGSRSASSYGWVYQHQGLRFVIEVNLYDNEGRFQSPSLERFVQQDPLGFGGGFTNLYVYVGNGPVNWLDPTGLRQPVQTQIPNPNPRQTPPLQQGTGQSGGGQGGTVAPPATYLHRDPTQWDWNDIYQYRLDEYYRERNRRYYMDLDPETAAIIRGERPPRRIPDFSTPGLLQLELRRIQDPDVPSSPSRGSLLTGRRRNRSPECARLPRLIFNLSGPMPNIAANIFVAIFRGKPDLLHREADRRKSDANGRAALRGLPPAGTELEWDEYPFRSSKEGGAGSQVAAVPAQEQRVQGGVLGAFYSSKQIGDNGCFCVYVLP